MPRPSCSRNRRRGCSMRRVVFASDDPRLEARGEAVRSIVDAALRIARDGVDNLVSFDELAAFPDRFRDVLERPVDDEGDGRLRGRRDRRGEGRRARAARGSRPRVRRREAPHRRDRLLRPGRRRLRDRARATRPSPTRCASASASCCSTSTRTRRWCRPICSPRSSRGSAVMAVGDPHQAIYGWRGASAGNLGGFAAAFSPGIPSAQYSLLTSWRNSARVLDAANAVLAPLAASAAVPVAGLRARPGAPAGEVEFGFDSDLDAEADRVAGWFDRVRAERGPRGRSTTGRHPLPQQEAHGPLRRRARSSRHPASDPGPRRAPVDARGRRRRVRAAGDQRPERRLGPHPPARGSALGDRASRPPRARGSGPPHRAARFRAAAARSRGGRGHPRQRGRRRRLARRRPRLRAAPQARPRLAGGLHRRRRANGFGRRHPSSRDCGRRSGCRCPSWCG